MLHFLAKKFEKKRIGEFSIGLGIYKGVDPTWEDDVRECWGRPYCGDRQGPCRFHAPLLGRDFNTLSGKGVGIESPGVNCPW
jgi:hypothetical protein